MVDDLQFSIEKSELTRTFRALGGLDILTLPKLRAKQLFAHRRSGEDHQGIGVDGRGLIEIEGVKTLSHLFIDADPGIGAHTHARYYDEK